VFNIGRGPFLTGCVRIEARATVLNFGKRSEPIIFVGSDQNLTIIGNLRQGSATLNCYMSTARNLLIFA
jgi:hypothetical protein